MKFLSLILAVLALALVASCATADNPQRLGGVTISGSCVFMDVGTIAKSGDNSAASQQTPHNDIKPDLNLNLLKGSGGASAVAGAAVEAAAAIKKNFAEPAPPAPAPVLQPQPVPLPAPQPAPAPKPDAAPISPAA